jgi:hypothetical protein
MKLEKFFHETGTTEEMKTMEINQVETDSKGRK